MVSYNGRRHVVICSRPDKFEVVMRRVESYTELAARITRNVVITIAMILGILTGSGALHQVAVFFG